MKSLPLLIALLAVSLPSYVYASHPPETNSGAGALLAQFLTDDEDGDRDTGRKKTIADIKKDGAARVKPQFTMGVSGGLDAREGFASISAMVPMGMVYGRYGLTFSPAYTYLSGKSIKTKQSPIDNILRTKMSGQIYEFSLPAMFSYYILDLPAHLYTPFVTGGAGYSYRKFKLDGSSLLSTTGREYYLHSMTLNYGFGFLVRTSDNTRFNASLTCQSYFNKRNGPFDYDTTGASIQFGLMIIID